MLVSITGVKIMRDLVLSSYQTEGDKLTGVELAPLKGSLETVHCATCITVQDTAIDHNTFEGWTAFCWET